MERWSLLVCLSLMLMLSGCVQDAPDAPHPTDDSKDAEGPAPERPLPGLATRNRTDAAPNATQLPENVMTQGGCQSFYSAHRVLMDHARPLLPEGLEPFRGDAGTTLLTTKAWTCPESTVDNISIASGAVLLYYIAVTPNETYAGEDVVFYWYPLQISAGSDDLAAAFTSWGFTVVDRQTVSVTWTQGFDPWVVTVSADGEAAVDGRITIPSFATEDDTFTVRYFAATEGTVTGGVDIAVHPGSRGGGGATALRYADPDLPAPVLAGTSSFQGWDTGTLSYTWTPVTFVGP